MQTWDDVLAIAADLPEVEVSTWFRTPALRISKKGFVRLRDEDGGLVVVCTLDEKAAFLARNEPAFYTTPHYDAEPAILVNLAHVDRHTLELLVTQAWTHKAPQRLRRGFPEFEPTDKHEVVSAPPKRKRKRKTAKAKAEDS